MSEEKKYEGFRLAHTMIRVRDLELSLNFYFETLRSEERRVGKECRSSCSPYY